MKKRNVALAFGTVGTFLSAGAFAAVDPAITTAISTNQADALTVSVALTVAILVVRTAKLLRRA